MIFSKKLVSLNLYIANIDEIKNNSKKFNYNIGFNAKAIEEKFYQDCQGKDMDFYEDNKEKLISKLQVTDF